MESDYIKILKRFDPKLASAVVRTGGRVSNTGIPMPPAVSEALTGAVFPALSCFVEWVLERAKAEGRQRIYFLARDGYLMYRMAERICAGRGISIECRYLYGSRYAWRIPQYHLDWEGCVNKICLGGLRVCFLVIMQRAGLTKEEALEIAAEYWPGLSGEALEAAVLEEIPYIRLGSWKEKLREDRRLRAAVEEKSKKALENAAGYLQQEGLTDPVPYALADSGWVGSIQQTLEMLLQCMDRADGAEQTDRRLSGYYYGLYSLPAGADRAAYQTWYFAPGRGLKNKVYFNNCLFECIFSSPEGSCTGYEKAADGRFRPVTEPGGSPNRQQMEDEERLLSVFLEEYLREYPDPEGTRSRGEEAGRRLSFALWRRLMTNPSPEEAKYFGTLLFTDDVIAGAVRETAPVFTKEEQKSRGLIRRLIGLCGGAKQMGMGVSAWPEGSLARSGVKGNRGRREEILHKYLLYGTKQLIGRRR